jgi:hypothetical protein
MAQSATWYRRIQGSELETVNALAEWLSPIPWQLFVTLAFPWNVASETADRKLREFINCLEKTLRSRVCHVAARESESKAGAGVPWHFHVLLTSLETIPADLVDSTWLKLAGRSSSISDRSDLALTRSFNNQVRAVEYLFKHVASETEWDMRLVELFHPSMGERQTLKHLSKRQKRRWDSQLARIAQVVK